MTYMDLEHEHIVIKIRILLIHINIMIVYSQSEKTYFPNLKRMQEPEETDAHPRKVAQLCRLCTNCPSPRPPAVLVVVDGLDVRGPLVHTAVASTWVSLQSHSAAVTQYLLTYQIYYY